jgi:Transposase DDE domain
LCGCRPPPHRQNVRSRLRRQASGAPTVKINAVRVEEIHPPPGVKPVVWLLLMTHPAESLKDRLADRGLVRARWTIEQVFRVMKSQGFDVEQSQIETPEAMAKLALAVLIAVLRVMQLVNKRSGTTGQKLADAMDEAAESLVEILTRKARAGDSAKMCGSVRSANRISGAQRAWLQYSGYNAAYTDFSIPPST